MNNNIDFIEGGFKAFEEEKFEDVIRLFSDIGRKGICDDNTLYKVYMCLGESCEKLSDCIKALDSFRKASDVAKRLNNVSFIFDALYKMVATYCTIKDYESAGGLSQILVNMAEENRDPILIARAYNAIGIICNDDPDSTLEMRENGIRAFEKALKNIEGLGEVNIEVAAHLNLGCAYTRIKQYDVALEHLFISKKFTDISSNDFFISTADFNISEAYLGKMELDKALHYLNKAMLIFENKNYRTNIAAAYELYSKVFEKKAQYKKALKYSKLYIELMLDIKNTDYIKTVSNLQMMYEVLKLEKDKEIYRIKNEELRQLNEELKAAYNVVNTLSETDFLTSFLNRRGLNYSLEELDSNSEHGIILLDIDYFKRINDNFGHHVGDEVLRSVAEKIRSIVDKTRCVLVRLGGEEFIIILKNSSKEEAFEFAKGILEIIKNEEFIVDGSKIKITLTGGIDSFCGRKEEFNEAVKRADVKLYEGKKLGRERIIL